MQGTLQSKRSLGKATAIVSDVSEGSRLWILSKDPATAGKQVIHDVLFAQSLAREGLGEYIQAAYPEICGILRNLGNVDLYNFAPLTWIRSEEVSRQLVRQIWEHKPDIQCILARMSVLNNNSGRWPSANEQLFRMWAALKW